MNECSGTRPDMTLLLKYEMQSGGNQQRLPRQEPFLLMPLGLFRFDFFPPFRPTVSNYKAPCPAITYVRPTLSGRNAVPGRYRPRSLNDRVQCVADSGLEALDGYLLQDHAYVKNSKVIARDYLVKSNRPPILLFTDHFGNQFPVCC